MNFIEACKKNHLDFYLNAFSFNVYLNCNNFVRVILTFETDETSFIDPIDNIDSYSVIDYNSTNLSLNVPNIEQISGDFFESVVFRGLSNNIPFEKLKSMASNSIDFFCRTEQYYPLYTNYLKEILSSSGKLDELLEKNYNCIFPDIVDIFSSEYNFIHFPIKKIMYIL